MTTTTAKTEIFGTYYYDCDLLNAWRNQNDRVMDAAWVWLWALEFALCGDYVGRKIK